MNSIKRIVKKILYHSSRQRREGNNPSNTAGIAILSLIDARRWGLSVFAAPLLLLLIAGLCLAMGVKSASPKLPVSDTHMQFFKDQWLACYNYEPKCVEYKGPEVIEESSKFWKAEWEHCVAILEPCFRSES